MKVELVTYVHDPIPSIQFVPETPWEEKMLEALWKYGKLESGSNYDGYGLRFVPGKKCEEKTK